MTENHGYNQPQQGSNDWHAPLNENFAFIDTDIEIRDQETARSDYVPKNGAKFFSTDTGAIYVGDGSSWVHIPQRAASVLDSESGDEIGIHVGSSAPSDTNVLWFDTS